MRCSHNAHRIQDIHQKLLKWCPFDRKLCALSVISAIQITHKPHLHMHPHLHPYSSQETVREKTLSVRKYVQENESLEFRNQQLSKRVAMLQDDLNSPARARKKKVWSRIWVFWLSFRLFSKQEMNPNNSYIYYNCFVVWVFCI